MRIERAGELIAGQNFTTIHTNRRGTVTASASYGEAVYVSFADGERKTLHRNVLLAVHWVN